MNDTTQKIVSVQTDHFSDWALIASLELTPTAKTVGLGENVTLKALRYVYPPGNNGPDDLAVPLAIPDAICGVPTKLDPGYIVKWTLNGPGKLTANGNEASYTAPSTMPANRRVTVTAELNVQGKQVLLVSTIYIIDEGISISIDYGDWHTYPAVGVKTVSPNRYGIVSQRVTPDIPQIIISWPVISGQNSAGMHEWFSKGEPENYIGFEDSDASINGIYTSVYEKDDELTDSGGYVTAEEFTEGGKKYVRGSFIISQSGLMDVSTGKQREIGFVVGTYKVQRKW
ncbi:MAG: hypothetical protein HZA79_00150 [Sphingobacteriales bacterium]|nr:hypothetical protein [Sphingobacteriales bacterium]